MAGPGFWKHGGYRGLGFLNAKYMGKYRPNMICDPGDVFCPDRKMQVHFRECLECEKFQVWHEKDQDFKRCWHEYKDLKSRGFYDGTWDDHPENFDPETFAEIQERKRINEEANREFELERSELEQRAEEIAEDPSYYYGNIWTEDDEEQEDTEDEDEDY